jgi:protein-S-isoprenylcysteine O-methyltransferase Ste14
VLYFVGWVVEVLVRLPHERQYRRIPKTDRHVTFSEQLLLAGLTVAMLILPLINSVTPWLNFANLRLSPKVRSRASSIGSLLLATAIWLFWRAHQDLGRNWSPSLEIGAGQTLTTRGIYRWIRHPMYASQLLYALAQALLLPNWIVSPDGLVAFLAFYLVRIPEEERMLRDHFGDAYRAYCKRTGRILPRLQGLLVV